MESFELKKVGLQVNFDLGLGLGLGLSFSKLTYFDHSPTIVDSDE
jgi:hypothetical protein